MKTNTTKTQPRPPLRPTVCPDCGLLAHGGAGFCSEKSMITTADHYEYRDKLVADQGGTIAVLADGRNLYVDPVTRDVLVMPGWGATPADVDAAAIIKDAQERGKFGREPDAPETDEAKAKREAGLNSYYKSKAEIERAMTLGGRSM